MITAGRRNLAGDFGFDSAGGNISRHVMCSPTPSSVHIVASCPLLSATRSDNMASRNLTKRFVECRNGAKANRNLHMQNDNVSENNDNGLIGVSN